MYKSLGVSENYLFVVIINLLSASILHKEELRKQMPSEATIDLYSCFKGDWGRGKSTEEH